jgi:formylglycine-generating enzyme required for sulfatase activity
MSLKSLDKYELFEEIRCDGFGIIYHACEMSLAVIRTVKVLHPALGTSAEFTERSHHERRIATQLEHPYVAPVYPSPKNPVWGLRGLVVIGLVAGGLGGCSWPINQLKAAPTNTPAAGSIFTPLPTATLVPTPTTLPEEITDAKGTKMRLVPAGEFTMGSTEDRYRSDDSEKPLHSVYLNAFWMDQTEVTNAMFGQFIAASGWQTEVEKTGKSHVYNRYYGNSINGEVRGADWQHPHGPNSNLAGFSIHPVTQVSWNDAQAYCAWRGARLPTEAEWEKAARGTDQRTFPWGNQKPSGILLNWDADKNENDGYQFTAPVGHYPGGASPYGIYDLVGNVLEWTADWYDSKYYESSLGRNPSGPASGDKRVLRGGAWSDEYYYLRSTYRFGEDPTFANDEIGFRCARSSAPPPTETPAPVPGEFVDAKGIKMQLVSEGKFTMGSENGDSNEKPVHLIYLDAFWMDQTEVTNAMFGQFIAAANWQTEADKKSKSYVFNPSISNWEEVIGADWQHPTGPNSSLAGLFEHPVTQVSWNDAQAYCAWRGARLPTEAEWEKAARGTDKRTYPWGNQNPAGTLLNFADLNLNIDWANKNENDGYQFTAPVGHYPAGASPYGIYDLAGNVWEWTADWYDGKYYQNSPERNPPGPVSGALRVLRGGAWGSNISAVHSALRLRYDPTFGSNSVGFRCVLSH